MKTPIIDFVRNYAKKHITRFHMPGHKGHVFFGWEPYDITEIEGADVLYHGDGIIAESEKNATALFGSGASHYSTCGSTSCIKAMLAILLMQRKACEGVVQRPYILAARNVHRSMVDACALLDLELQFLELEKADSLCSSVAHPKKVREALQSCKSLPLGVYVTSPDYLGQLTDIAAISVVCREAKVPLLVDNAHGAYLHFLKEKKHPLDLGAAMCCDSAHKTFPALTSTAYLHIHRDYLEQFEPYAKQALSLFCTTSPSYLLLQSLDYCNAYLMDAYPKRLKELTEELESLKKELRHLGICVKSSEPLRVVIDTSQNGYTGEEIADELRAFQIECEYADWQNVVWMVTPENTKQDWDRVRTWAQQSRLVQKKKTPLPQKKLSINSTNRKMTIREAVFSESETIPVESALHRVCATQTVSCPPAIPIAISGEEITEEMIQEFLKFGIHRVSVVKE